MAAFATLEMYEELARLLQQDPEWSERGQTISCSMSFRYEEPVAKQFYLRFVAGRVEEVRELPLEDVTPTDFVFSGPPEIWRQVFRSEIPPAMAIMGGKLEIKGKKSWLLQNMLPFKHVLDTFKKVDLDDGDQSWR